MKQLKFLVGSILFLSLLPGCVKSYDPPLITEPSANGLERNLTIAEFKKLYASLPDRRDDLIDVDYVLRATVVGNDISGNIYSSLYVQDETAGIVLSVSQSDVYTDYPVGQTVFVKLKGLSAVRFGGQLQVGMKDTHNNRIPYELFKIHVVRDGWSKAENAIPKVVTISEIKAGDALIGQLVQINKTEFVEAGSPFAPPLETVNRTLRDATGSLIVRNSGYAKFAGDLIPSGVGTVVGVVGKYNADYQLFLRDRSDVFDFVPGSIGGSEPTPPTPGPSEQSKSAKLLFPGSDFEDWKAFESSLTGHGLKGYGSKEKESGRDGSSALKIKTTSPLERNDYLFSTYVTNIPADAKPTKISFYVKGTSTKKSMSINVYTPTPYVAGNEQTAVVGYNIGDLTTHKTIAPKIPSASDTFVNDYNGTIDTKGQWVLVTLDLTGIQVKTTRDKTQNTFAIKLGKESDFNLLIDNIKFE